MKIDIDFESGVVTLDGEILQDFTVEVSKSNVTFYLGKKELYHGSYVLNKDIEYTRGIAKDLLEKLLRLVHISDSVEEACAAQRAAENRLLEQGEKMTKLRKRIVKLEKQLESSNASALYWKGIASELSATLCNLQQS